MLRNFTWRLEFIQVLFLGSAHKNIQIVTKMNFKTIILQYD